MNLIAISIVHVACGMVVFASAIWLLSMAFHIELGKIPYFSALIVASVLEWSGVVAAILGVQDFTNRFKGLGYVLLCIGLAVIVTGISVNDITEFGYV